MKAIISVIVMVVLFISTGELSSQEITRATSNNSKATKASTSTYTVHFGYPTKIFPSDTTLEAYHKDVVGGWFEAPLNGVIDTIFFQMGDSIGSKDSVVFLKIRSSNINKTQGPGYGYPSPPTPWGYWLNTNDLDQSIAPYPEEATNPEWQSTISESTFAPFYYDILWDAPFPVNVHPNTTNAIPISELPVPFVVSKGDVFFLGMRVNSPATHPAGYESSTDFKAVRVDQPMDSRAWAFWEHNLGWHALGTLNCNIWFSLSTQIDSFSGNYHVSEGWNLVSLPRDVTENNKTTIFPTAASSAYSYSHGYTEVTTLQPSRGYWLKFNADEDIPITGAPLLTDTIDVSAGWNLIGSLVSEIPVTSVKTIPAGVATTPFYEYNTGYSVASSIIPGKGYWVKVNQDAKIVLSVFSELSASNALFTIHEQPPPPPFSNDEQVPEGFTLEQNYPNPFNPSTYIRYNLPKTGFVSLNIYDMLGKEIATLVDGVQEAGYKVERWDASSLTGGIYFCRLTYNGMTEVQKLVLLK